MRKFCLGTLSAFAGLSLASSVAFAADGKCGKVSLAKMNWASASVIAHRFHQRSRH